jgi:NTE family protein
MKAERIGLALSGGGIRAAIFHLGTLRYLAEAKTFDKIASISSVSGASLAIGLIFAANNNKWPTGDEFIKTVEPKIRELIMENDVQTTALWRLPFSPKYWFNRVELLANIMERKWGIIGTLQDLPKFPFWEINCTTYETGKSFRFRRDFMGDYSIGYARNPQLPISHMIAASAGFPVLIGPYRLSTAGQVWTKDKHGKAGQVTVEDAYTLWDGGVYDNLGLEALYKIGEGLDGEIDFLIVSNASASIPHARRKRNVSVSNMLRLLNIAMSQVDALRTREIMAYVITCGNGIYLKIGNSAEYIANSFDVPAEISAPIIAESLSAEDAAKARDYATTLKSPPTQDYELIFRHGYENAKCVDIFRVRKVV